MITAASVKPAATRLISAPPSPRQRLAAALLVGVLSGLLTYAQFTWRGCVACDFTAFWRAAWYVRSGIDPYTHINPEGAYPWDAQFFYPLPAALVVMPFTFLPPTIAGALFLGCSAGLLAYGVLKDGWGRMPLFLSTPFMVAAAMGQWSPLITALALLPAAQALALAKPTLGAAAFLYRPTWKAAITGAVFLLLSLVIMPRWPFSWWLEMQNRHSVMAYKVPALAFFPLGLLLLAAVLRWRSPQGRLLLVMALIPQYLWFYDQLLLWLIPQDWKESWLLTILSWLAYGLWRINTQGIPLGETAGRPDVYVMALCYLPALALLFKSELRRRIFPIANNRD